MTKTDPVARIWGERIRERRERLQLSQIDLAAAVGVTQTAVSKWENGECAPSRRHQPKLALALRERPARLFEYPLEAAA